MMRATDGRAELAVLHDIEYAALEYASSQEALQMNRSGCTPLLKAARYGSGLIQACFRFA
jgi:hypothetical protein